MASHRSPRWILYQALYGFLLTGVTAAVFIFSFTSGYDLEVGDVAPEDIRAPYDVTYASEILSQQAREDAARKVQQVYTRPDARIARQQLNRMRDVMAFLSALRADTYASPEQKQAWVLAVEELQDLPPNSINILLSLSDSHWNDVQVEARRLLDQVMRQNEIREGDLERIRERVSTLVPLELPQDEATLIADLVKRFLVPNVFYAETETEAKREQARESVNPVFRTLQSGQIVVREWSVITSLDLEALDHLGLTSRDRVDLDVGVVIISAAMFTLLLSLYIYRMQPEVFDDLRLEGLLLLLLIIFILLARLVLPAGTLLPYLFPGAALAMIVATTVGQLTALGATFFLGGVCAWITGNALSTAAQVILSGVAAVLVLPRYEQTGVIFKAGLLAGMVKGVVLFTFSATDFTWDPVSMLLKVGVCVAGGIISGGLTLGGLFLLAQPFGLTTAFRLLELSSPNHPLLQRLLREAPGTFNHSMMVASMAEQAAERIGADDLLTRVGCYYHDIGKLMRPYFFVENQGSLSNPHDRLDPYTSADVLMGHVRDGMKLARQYRLPDKIRAFIVEHHGTMRVSFLYHKAVEAADGEPGLVDESQFRYPGPRPRSRETLLLMLADSAEAATRARRPKTPEELAEIVDLIFDQRIKDGQLDECPITMHELQAVKRAYIDLLRGAYHPRIKYPEPEGKKEDIEGHEP
jgi:hypothetical protein